MQLSQTGLDFIKQWEKFEPRPYRDAGGYLTIGYGHKILPGESFTSISEAQALELLGRDASIAVAAVNSTVRVPLTQAMFDALVSLVFNWGVGNWQASTHLSYLNAGDYQRTAQRISEHPVTSNGVYFRGLARRRAEESQLFLSQGIPGENPIRPPATITPAADNRSQTAPFPSPLIAPQIIYSS